MSPEHAEILELRALVLELRGDVQRLARLLVQDRLTAAATPPAPRREDPHAARNEKLRELAAAFGLGATWPAALQTLLVLAGKRPPPQGCEALVAELLADGARLPTSQRMLHEILKG